MKQATLWRLSAMLSAVLFLVLILLWVKMNELEVEHRELVDEQAVTDYLATHWEKMASCDHESYKESPIKIKTGIFIQSLQFSNSSEVNITGYLWQRYEKGLNYTIKPDLSEDKPEVGFIFPDQVNSANDIEPRLVYSQPEGDEQVIGWYFEATLRQPFDYSDYPFDHKTVWIRMWPKDFYKNIVLVPDYEAYKNGTGVSDIFGIDEKIVLGTWERKNTYFNYQLSSYDSDFGIADYKGHKNFPELHYNFVVKRKFQNAFIIYLLPLFLVAALLFAALLTVSAKEDLSNTFGFNVSGFIGASSALFFVVMLAHIQLRQQFAGTSIVYLEYFYIVMYAMLVTATANTYLFSIRSTRWHNIILYKDNIIPKVAYWPVTLGVLIIITLLAILFQQPQIQTVVKDCRSGTGSEEQSGGDVLTGRRDRFAGESGQGVDSAAPAVQALADAQRHRQDPG